MRSLKIQETIEACFSTRLHGNPKIPPGPYPPGGKHGIPWVPSTPYRIFSQEDYMVYIMLSIKP